MRTLLLLLLLSVVTVFGQQKMTVDFDYSRFSYSDSADYVEFYYSFNTLTMAADSVASGKEVRGLLKVNIVNQASKDTLVNKEFKFKSALVPGQNNTNLIGNLGYVIPPGNYRVMLQGKDLIDKGRGDSVAYNLSVNKRSDKYYSISDLQFASNIRQSDDTASLFYKNTYEVVPNPGAVFGDGLPVVYYYTELYNINRDKKSETLILEESVMNSKNISVYNKKKVLPRKSNSIVQVGTAQINKLPTGTYTFTLSVSDTTMNLKAVSAKKFFVFNPSILDTIKDKGSDVDYISSEFASMGDEELAEVFLVSKYIATKTEIDQWNKLTDTEGKRAFLFNFWKNRDEVPATPENEYKKEYFKRITHVNTAFATFQKKGWRTDRGRVFIVYGEPSEIERHPNEVDMKPYEIWYYNQIEGGVMFIFGDLTGFNDYQLLNSTMRGELRDDNWGRKVSQF